MLIRDDRSLMILCYILGLLVVSQCSETSDRVKFSTVGEDRKENKGSGLLIAEVNGVGGTVCDDNFNSISATLICKELNFNCSLGWHSRGSREIQENNNYNIMLDNIACNGGDESFADCGYDTQHNCEHSEDVFLSCADDCNFHFKLLDKNGKESTEGSGLLVASRTINSEIGTVCDDGFNETSATVICKEMGYTCSVYWSPQEEWALETTELMNIMLDNVKCANEKLDFQSCSFTYSGHNCNHEEDVHLICSNECKKETVKFKLIGEDREDTTSTGQGLLIANRNIANYRTVNGTVCDDEFTMTTAGVVCREMGFDCALFFNSGEKWNAVQSEYSVILESVVCEEGEDTTFRSNCTYNTDNDCAHNEDIFLFCDKGDDCKNPNKIEFTLVTEEDNQTKNGSGLLIATTALTNGTVCDDWFSDSTATLVCKKMDYECAVSWESADKWAIQSEYSIALDDLQCQSDKFSECSFELSHNCGHREDLFLSCTTSKSDCQNLTSV